jgi:hypothetical protein
MILEVGRIVLRVSLWSALPRYSSKSLFPYVVREYVHLGKVSLLKWNLALPERGNHQGRDQ